MSREIECIREPVTDRNGSLIGIAKQALSCRVLPILTVRKGNPVLRVLLFLFLIVAAFQAAPAGSSLYLFRKGGGEGYAVVEAVQEEKMAGILKLTSADGKMVAWQEDMLAVKIGLFDVGVEVPDPALLEASLAAVEKFIEKEPTSAPILTPLVEKWKTCLVRTKVQTEENTRKNDEEKLARFLSEEYKAGADYPLETLEAKGKLAGELTALLPDQSAKIAEYWKPWSEELTNRKAGLERFEGRWVSPEAIAREKTERQESLRKGFEAKELVFRIAEEAVSVKAVYLTLGLMGLSFLFLGATFLGGVKGLFKGPGAVTWIALVVGGGGLAAYGFGIWLLCQKSPQYADSGIVVPKAELPDRSEAMALNDLIFYIHQPPGSEVKDTPAKISIDDPALNSFLKSYVKLIPASEPEGLGVLRKGLKVQVRDDRILIFDEMVWAKKEVVVCYTLYFSETDGGFQFGRAEASVGNLPLPGRIFRHFWSQVEPLMGDVLTRSRVLENYCIKRMQPGVVEMISLRAAPKQAAR